MKTRFVHFRDFEYRGGATVAYEISGDRESNQRHIQYGVAFCSPKDGFNKSFGRKLAENRLNCDRTCRTLDITLDSQSDISIQIISSIREDLLTHKRVSKNGKTSVLTRPNWVASRFSLHHPFFGQKDKYYATFFEQLTSSFELSQNDFMQFDLNQEVETQMEDESVCVVDNA
jgi:hypothetical protein